MTYWKNKVAVVVGGSAGLGLHLAQALIAKEADVAIVARDRQRLETVKSELGSNVSVFQADVTQQTDVDGLHVALKQQYGHIDALINCAGKSTRGEILQTTPEEFEQLFALNFLGTVRMTRALMPQLLESRGHIVNVGSLAAKAVSRYLGAYPVSKFPVAAYSQQLRLELGPEGVHVLLVCPGPIARADAGQRYTNSDVPAAAQKPGGGVKLKGLDPQKLASRVLAACESRELELIMPAKARLLFAVAQLSPRWGDWLISKMTKT